ncbi:MAG: OmpA family protein [Cytophagia bacterium]|nr:MAG: OmpA family protein [Runella sp.]TAG23981.1 MAG: OmpA family protein [Cytophagales bacterium]TAG34671.1 MAG: OmpA family protein [Cytophagia bacterium]TAG53460.1 MAG: OmpA family protein [Runella slithyformis]TAG76715.1 MAG: OmpA family protein [Cytophagales bacterium]
MKNLFCILLFTISISVVAQVRVNDPKQTTERNVEGRVNNRIDRGIDRGLDKVEEGIGNIFKKKRPRTPEGGEKEDKQSEEEKDQSQREGFKTKNQTSQSGEMGQKDKQKNAPSGSWGAVYSKFDFVPGEKVIALDDFSTTSVGDFPLGWNTNSSAEIVTLDDSPTKWLFMSKDGFFQPNYVKDLPENFTLEFDMYNRYVNGNLLTYRFMIYGSDNPKRDLADKYIAKSGIFFGWGAGTGAASFFAYENGEETIKNESLNIKELEWDDTPAKVRFSIWRQKTRLRIYVNQNKVLDIPQAFDAKAKYNVFKLGGEYMNFATTDNKDEFMVANVRYAVGAPDTRSKLITEGKFSTTGILFDVNSDKIKPESYGVLKELGTVLKENATVKVRIIGHTDADGDDAKNLDLSKRRAASVKAALATEFGIDATRMETDGKGETQPAAPNTTAEGKANNRRVEFIKL